MQLMSMASVPPPPPARAAPMKKRSAALYDASADDGESYGAAAVGRGASLASGSSASIVMRVEGKISAEADGGSHKVSLADLDLQAAFVYISVPVMNPAAFLQVSFIRSVLRKMSR